MRNKPKLIIIEGSQGVGKGSITTLLRENIPYSTLMRLSGIEDSTSSTGKIQVFNLRKNELDLILNTYESKTTYILDRSHISEKVYCNLGYKQYDFQNENNILNSYLDELGFIYDIYFIVLTCTEESYISRLNRNKAEVKYSKFNVSNSIRQQKEYIKELNELSKYNNIRTLELDNTNDLNTTYENIINFIK